MRHFLARYAGPIAFAVALIAALDGRWRIAAAVVALGALLMWLGGEWAFPRSTNAYLRRVDRVFADWYAYENWAVRREGPPPSPTPPDVLRTDHERIVGLLSESRAAWDDAGPLPDRARRTTAALRAAHELLNGIRAGATSEAARTYVANWEALRTAQHDRDSRELADIERSAQSTARKLDRVRPPAAVAAEHAALIKAVHAHRTAGRELYEAMLARDPDRAAAAAAGWDEGSRQIQNHAHRIAARLGRPDAWPAAQDA